jgi:hypothetical protein
MAATRQGRANAADDELRRRLIELLDLRVEVMGWKPCDTCDAKGLIPTTNEIRRQGNTGVGCPDCLRTRHIPALRVTGQIPELLLASLGDGAEVRELPSERVGVVLLFEPTCADCVERKHSDPRARVGSLSPRPGPPSAPSGR